MTRMEILDSVVLRIVVAKSRPVRKSDDHNSSSEDFQAVLRIVVAESTTGTEVRRPQLHNMTHGCPDHELAVR